MKILGVIGTNDILIILLTLGLILIPAIFFLLTQQNTLRAIQPQNRSMSPGEVWLQLIPLFNLIWQFIVVTKIANSIQRELNAGTSFSFEQSVDYSYDDYGPKPTYGIGIAYCGMACASVLPLGFLSSLLSLACLVCWIIYWVQLAGYKSRIEARNSGSSAV